MYRKIYVPLDNSDHSMSAIEAAVTLGKAFDAELVGCHAYAAKMHDIRFKQMEFTLPEEYLVEGEMEKQRKVHDTLITMGLELISDSYNVVMQKRCLEENLPFEAKMLEGKNYKVLAQDINESDYDLVIMGALGLAAVRDSLIGSVCERVVRRIKTDTLVIKEVAPAKKSVAIGENGEVVVEEEGAIVVAVDGSPESFAGLKTAIALGKKLDKRVEAIAVYDPYMHYAMFNSLVNVLTEKAAKVFKFKEQEQLHEDVIDTGLAKIYQSHLEIARKVAEEDGIDLKITLLDGKAFEKIIQYVRREKPWLLVLGRIGVHSDQDMDIGSNTENLLRLAPCNVLLSSKRYVPPLDVKAEESMTWLQPATDLLNTAPEFVRGLARTTIHRWAMERGHSVITRKVIEQAMSSILPKSSLQKMGIIAEEVALERIDGTADSVTWVCGECGYHAKNFEPVTCGVCGADRSAFHKLDRETIENLAPLEGGVETESTFDDVKLKWTAEAKAALAEVPEGYQRRRARAQIEKSARVKQLEVISKEIVEAITGTTMEATGNLEDRGRLGASAVDGAVPEPGAMIRDGSFSWTADAVARINRVPEGYMRNITKKRIEGNAKDQGVDIIDLDMAEAGIAIGRKIMEEMIAKQEADKLRNGSSG